MSTNNPKEGKIQYQGNEAKGYSPISVKKAVSQSEEVLTKSNSIRISHLIPWKGSTHAHATGDQLGTGCVIFSVNTPSTSFVRRWRMTHFKVTHQNFLRFDGPWSWPACCCCFCGMICQTDRGVSRFNKKSTTRIFLVGSVVVGQSL